MDGQRDISFTPKPLTSFEIIDLYRALAAYAVVVQHSRQMLIVEPATGGYIDRALSFLCGCGRDAVMAFFVISGYWIVKSITKQGIDFSWSNYIVARLSRLYLVLIPALLIGGLLDFFGVTHFGGRLYAGVSDNLTWTSFAGTIFFLQTTLVAAFGSNGPLWSLAYEFFYYLWFPSLWMAIRYGKLTVFLLLTIVTLFAANHMIVGFFVWLMGGAVAAVESKLPKISKYYFGVAVAAFVLAVIARRGIALDWTAGSLLIGAGFSLILLTTICTRITFPAALRPLAIFGASGSFSLYATHFPIVVLLASMIVPNSRLDPSPASWLLVLLLTLPPVIFAWAFARYTERNTEKVRRWILDAFAIRKPEKAST
jgi:peptidoglycan/LPS O-acetylase OafA/YrhL